MKSNKSRDYTWAPGQRIRQKTIYLTVYLHWRRRQYCRCVKTRECCCVGSSKHKFASTGKIAAKLSLNPADHAAEIPQTYKILYSPDMPGHLFLFERDLGSRLELCPIEAHHHKLNSSITSVFVNSNLFAAWPGAVGYEYKCHNGIWRLVLSHANWRIWIRWSSSPSSLVPIWQAVCIKIRHHSDVDMKAQTLMWS